MKPEHLLENIFFPLPQTRTNHPLERRSPVKELVVVLDKKVLQKGLLTLPGQTILEEGGVRERGVMWPHGYARGSVSNHILPSADATGLQEDKRH